MRLFSFLLVFLSFTPLQGQENEICHLSDVEFNALLCLEGYTDYKSILDGQEFVDLILSSVNIPDANFEIKPCRNIENAAAIIWNDKRFVLFDDYFLKTVNGSDDYWFFVFVFAHEIAHHLNGHTLDKGRTLYERRQDELECDQFAGAIIRKFNGNISVLRKSLNKLPHPKTNTTSHPVFSDRLSAAEKGFNDVISMEQQILEKYNVVSADEYEYLRWKSNVKIARENFRLFQKTQKYGYLEAAETAYKGALQTSAYYPIHGELGEVYTFLNLPELAAKHKLLAYEKSSIPEFLIEATFSCTETEKKNCTELFKAVDQISISSITHPLYFSQLSSIYFENRNYKKTIETIDYCLNKLNTPELKLIERSALHMLHNTKALSLLRLGKHELALDNSIQAKSYIDKDYEAFISNGIFLQKDLDLNKLSIYANFCLLNMVTKNWDKCIQAGKELILFVQHNDLQSAYDPALHYYLGKSYAMLGKYELALQELDKAVKLNPSDFNLYHYRGMTYYKLNKLDKAISDWTIGCQNGDKYCCEFLQKINQPSTNSNHGNLPDPQLRSSIYSLIKSGQPGPALDLLNKKINEIEKENLLCDSTSIWHGDRGYVYILLNNPKEAINELNKMIKFRPNDLVGFDLRQEAYFRLGNYSAALSDLNFILKNSKEFFPYVYFRKAIIFGQIGEKEKAAKNLKIILDNKKNAVVNETYQGFFGAFDLATVYNNYGYHLVEIGKPKKAKPFVEKALQLNPNHSFTHGTQGILFYDLKEFQKSIKSLSESISIIENKRMNGLPDGNANPGLAYHYRGMAKIKLGDKLSGCRDLSKAGEFGITDAYSEIKKNCN